MKKFYGLIVVGCIFVGGLQAMRGSEEEAAPKKMKLSSLEDIIVLQPALYDAITYNNPGAVEAAVANGASVNDPILHNNMMPDMTESPLYYAYNIKAFHAFETLLRLGANINETVVGLVQDTLLHAAIGDGRTDYVFLLLSHGADLNRRDSTGRTALQRAQMTLEILPTAAQRENMQRIIHMIESYQIMRDTMNRDEYTLAPAA
jgi:hypothetical protein